MEEIKRKLEKYVGTHSEITDDTHEDTVKDLLYMFTKYAKLKCAEQRELCASYAEDLDMEMLAEDIKDGASPEFS